ncbi:MAG TPA: AgmX/PglI C-terminal domain-containing protein [Kofleriaceae bacterium]
MMKKLLVLVVLAAAACGGKNKDAEEGGATIDTQATTGDPTDRSGEQVGPEKMDEINNLLGRKQMIISRCLSVAVEAGEAPKGVKAKVTVALSIAPSGSVSKVDVIKSTIDLQSVQSCVKGHVQAITFPNVPKTYDTSFTYAMEAN